MLDNKWLNKQEYVFHNRPGQELLSTFWANVVLSNAMLQYPKYNFKDQPEQWSGYTLTSFALPMSYHEKKFTGMIKKCVWKGQPISCAAIFEMQPTDRGMCCSFNKEKADEMFREGKYQEHLIDMRTQDEMHAMDDSKLPEWLGSLP